MGETVGYLGLETRSSSELYATCWALPTSVLTEATGAGKTAQQQGEKRIQDKALRNLQNLKVRQKEELQRQPVKQRKRRKARDGRASERVRGVGLDRVYVSTLTSPVAGTSGPAALSASFSCKMGVMTPSPRAAGRRK